MNKINIQRLALIQSIVINKITRKKISENARTIEFRFPKISK